MALSAKTCEMHAPALGSSACVPHLLNDTVKCSLERTSQLQLSSPNVDHFARSGLRCVVCTVLTHHKIRGPPESHCTSQKESFRVAKNDVFLLSPLGTSYVARIHFWRNLRKPDLRKHLNITNPEGKHIWATEFWEILWQNLLIFVQIHIQWDWLNNSQVIWDGFRPSSNPSFSVGIYPFGLRLGDRTGNMLKFYRSMQQSAHVAVSGVIAAHIAVPKINILEASRI